MSNTLLDSSQEEKHRIRENFEIFEKFVTQAKDYTTCKNYELAAIYADIAEEYASYMCHCGLFSSPELEQVLLTIGKEAIKPNNYIRKNYLANESPHKILHVVDNVWTTGGHSRLLWRWIGQDKEKVHSVVFTRMLVEDTPGILRDAVLNTGGELHELNKESFIERAKQLREIASSSEVVVLHTIHHGSIVTIAFADREKSPPIIYVNHADERFWLGVSISDVVANLRESGMRLSQKRRYVYEKRNMLLPTIVEPAHRVMSRLEAKKKLGIDENHILLISIARGVKYQTSDGSSYADAHISLLKKYKQALLIVVGPGDLEDWSAAIQQTEGRIRLLGETPHTAVFYEAADIYVDSFPFVSITSLLEAGSYSIPLVSRYPYDNENCEIFGADMPGLTGNLIRVNNHKEYETVLSELIENEELRLSLGERTRKKIEEIHTGKGWQISLETIYKYVASIEPIQADSSVSDRMSIGEPDIFTQTVCPFNGPDFDKLIIDRVRLMPFQKRFSFWIKQIQKGNIGRTGNITFILSEWLYRRLLKLLRR